MTNPFERHGIHRLSASSLNLARANTAAWLISYGYDVKQSANLPMMAGSVTEKAVEFGICNPDASIADCKSFAEKEWGTRTRLSGFKDTDRLAKLDTMIGYGSARKSYSGMVENAVKELRQYGVPTETQIKVETQLDGIPIPIIGFKDFSYDEHGLDVDLKTTGRMPTDMSADHQLQGAIYWRASNNRTQRFCYATKSEAKVLELEPYAANYAIAQATQIAHTLMRLLAISNDISEICALTIPDYDNFRWSPPTRAKAEEVWASIHQTEPRMSVA